MAHILRNKRIQYLALPFIILGIVGIGFFCCVPSGHAMTQALDSSMLAKAQTSMPACHAQEAKAATPTKQDCTCCLKQLQADYPVPTASVVPQFSKSFLAVNFSQDSFCALESKINLAFLHGPPGSLSDIPLYLRLRNFRI
ncbi:MAG: hypothetical protein NUV91_08810 [Candidatus Omnitrophica bacterium]|nr:hypothetical protein [Candidatus Omnitrophota bacterium]